MDQAATPLCLRLGGPRAPARDVVINHGLGSSLVIRPRDLHAALTLP